MFNHGYWAAGGSLKVNKTPRGRCGVGKVGIRLYAHIAQMYSNQHVYDYLWNLLTCGE